MRKRSNTIIVVLFASCISLNILASTLTVNWDGTGDYLKIQNAIKALTGGDTIVVMPGIYNENVDYLRKILLFEVVSQQTP